MELTGKKRKPVGRGERHSATWGKRLAVLVLAFVAEVAFAQTKLSPELQHAKSGKPVNVIVQFTSDPTERRIAKVTGKGAALKHKLSVIHGPAFTCLSAMARTWPALSPAPAGCPRAETFLTPLRESLPTQTLLTFGFSIKMVRGRIAV